MCVGLYSTGKLFNKMMASVYKPLVLNISVQESSLDIIHVTL